MTTLKIKHRKFEITEIIKDDAFKAEYKNKEFFVKKYDLNSSEGRVRFVMVQKVAKTGVVQPKLKFAEKKTGYVVKEYVDGTLMKDYILDHDFDENIYKQIFFNSYMAKAVGLTLDFNLDSWMMVGDKLYYVGEYCDKYTPEKDFTRNGITLWFFTKDLAKYYEKNGILFDKTRIKEEFAVNKEMVLMTCKYYQ